MKAFQKPTPRRRLATTAIVLATTICGLAPLLLTAQEAQSPTGKSGETVNVLMEKYASAKYFWEQGEVAQKLIALGDKGIIPKLEKYLDATERKIRCNAALVLAGLGDKRGLAILIGELEDKEPRPIVPAESRSAGPEGQISGDRYYAALLLGQLGKKEAVPALVKATTDESVNYIAAIALGDIGDKSAVPALHKMARDFPAQRLWAGYGLAALGEPTGFDILTEVITSDPAWTDRRHAVDALGKFGNPKSVPLLVKALKDKHVNVRVSAASALGKIGDAAALPALTEALSDREATEVNAPTTTADEARKAIAAIKEKKR